MHLHMLTSHPSPLLRPFFPFRVRGDRPGISDGKDNVTKGANDCWLNKGNIMHSASKGGTFCPHGQRQGLGYVLSGNIIPLWPLIKGTLLDNLVDGGKFIQIVRCKNPVTGERIVGLDVRYRQVRIECLKWRDGGICGLMMISFFAACRDNFEPILPFCSAEGKCVCVCACGGVFCGSAPPLHIDMITWLSIFFYD